MPWVAPVSLLTPATVMAKQTVPNGDLSSIIKPAHKIIVVYLIRVARTHNLPSLAAPIKEHKVRPSQGHPILADVAALESSVQWHLINE